MINKTTAIDGSPDSGRASTEENIMNRRKAGETSIKRAAAINMGSRYTAALISLVYSVVLARMLPSEDFGIVAIAQVFVTFFQLFSDMGLGSAIVQRQDLDEVDISRIFGFSVLLAIVLGAGFCGIAFPVATLYGEERLRGICLSLSATVVFATINTVPNALLMKSRRFVLVGTRQILAIALASVLGITSAALGAGPYAIVVYSVSNALIAFLWNWLTNRTIPVFSGMSKSVRKVWGYSAWLFGFNFITYFNRNADNLLIGYFFGSAPLGNYSKAYQLMQYPQTYLTTVVTSVMHPMLAKRQEEVDYIYEVFIKTTKALSLVGVFISVLCWFAADEIVAVLYGDGWAEAAVCLRFMSASIWSQMVCGTSGAMFQVLNRTREQFIRVILIFVFVICAIMAGVWLGSIETVAIAVGISYYANFSLLLPFLIRRSFNKDGVEFLRLFLPELVIAMATSIALFAISGVLACAPLPSLLVKVMICGAVYGIMLVITKQTSWLVNMLPRGLRQRFDAFVQRLTRR